MRFEDFSGVTQNLSLIAMLLMLIANEILMYFVIRNKMKKRFFFISLAAAVFSFFWLSIGFATKADVLLGNELPLFEHLLMTTPAAWFIVIFLIDFAIIFLVLFLFVRYRKSHITPPDIVYGFNHMGMGICLYLPNGIPKITNIYIDNLAFKLTGKHIYDGNQLFKDIKEAGIATIVRESENSMVVRDRHYVYRFNIAEFELDKIKYMRMIVTDVTLEYSLYDELHKENEKRREYQEKLKNYSNELEAITINEEILKTKMNIHNEYGHILLIGKYSLSHEEVREEFLGDWRKLSNLIFEEPENDSEELQSMAESLGISLDLCEVYPKHREVVYKMVYEVLTNTIRHSKSNHILVTKEIDEHGITYRAHNDEEIEAFELKPGGGLSSLMHLSESKRAEFSYQIGPYFILQVKFREEE